MSTKMRKDLSLPTDIKSYYYHLKNIARVYNYTNVRSASI